MALAPARVSMAAEAKKGDIIEIKALIRHVMETGHRVDAGGQPIPRDIISLSSSAMAARRCFAMELNPGISANPYVIASRWSRPKPANWSSPGRTRKAKRSPSNKMLTVADEHGGLMRRCADCSLRFFIPRSSARLSRARPSGTAFLVRGLKAAAGDEAANPGMFG